MSDIDIVLVDSRKALDPNRPLEKPTSNATNSRHPIYDGVDAPDGIDVPEVEVLSTT